MTEKFTTVDDRLDPEKIFARGFITREESEAVELAKFSSKINITDEDGENEGIWAAIISEEDRALYDGSTVGETLRVVLTNHALMFMPNPSWGRVIEGKTNGGKRPIFIREDQLPRLKKTHEAYLEEYPPPPLKEEADGSEN